MSTLLRLILAFFHIIYSIYLFAAIQWALLQREFIGLIRPRSLKLPENILEECDVNEIKKLPSHLVFVIGCEDISFVDLSKIIDWCVALGISCVSFYDRNGIVKANSNNFKREFEKLRPNLVSKVVWSEKYSTDTTVNGTDGFKSPTRVNFLSFDDGKPTIVKLTKELSQAVVNGSVKIEEIDTNLLNEKLKINHFPDPDIAIIAGKTFSTFGLLPWHIRITEFFNLPTHHSISPKEFIDILKLYSKCEKRYGK